MSHTAEFMKTEDAASQFKDDLDEIDFEDIDAVLLITCRDGDVSFNAIGDLDLVAETLRSALRQVERDLGQAPN